MQSGKIRPRRRARNRPALAVIAFMASPALAAENDWNTVNSGNWSNGANWTLGVPVNGQDVVIGHGPVNEGNPDLTVTFDATLTGNGLNSLTLDSEYVQGYAIINQTAQGTAMI